MRAIIVTAAASTLVFAGTAFAQPSKTDDESGRPDIGVPAFPDHVPPVSDHKVDYERTGKGYIPYLCRFVTCANTPEGETAGKPRGLPTPPGVPIPYPSTGKGTTGKGWVPYLCRYVAC